MKITTLKELIQEHLIDSKILINAQAEIVEPDDSSLLFLHQSKVVLISHRWLIENQLKEYETNLRMAISIEDNGFRITTSGHHLSSSLFAKNKIQLFARIGAFWSSNRTSMILENNIPEAYTTI